jgi:hypothetical protein
MGERRMKEKEKGEHTKLVPGFAEGILDGGRNIPK